MKKLVRKEMSKKFIEYRNFAKISACLADYGYVSLWNRVDDKGADFICTEIKTSDVLKIQLKGRVSVSPKDYGGKDIYMAFPKNDRLHDKDWVIVPHDKLNKIFKNKTDSSIGRSSGAIPNKYWEEIKQIAILGPFDLI